jgi:hypothetical protein
MMRKIARALGYAKAPKASYVMKHPVKGANALPLAYMAVRRVQR